MLFNTLDFVFFLPIIIIGYYLVKPKYRWMLLLSASYYFYMCWKIEYVVLIALSTIIDYFVGLRMGRIEEKRKRRPYLWLSLATNLGLLMGFKYYNFFSTSATDVAQELGLNIHFPLTEVLLPVGISFYTFQTLSYSIDVYKGKQKPERHLGYFALYVSFFPQLVAGPIERFSRLTPQLKKTHHFNLENLRKGMRLILFGLFAKMVVADNLAPMVDAVYSQPEMYNSLSIGLAMVFYSFQIYGDFFGYSLIAIGSAQLLGIGLMDNFKTPYLSTNIAEFWRRWHISLSTWFRDYLYFPMGGNRVKTLRWIVNILIVFVISGFWHGANFTFLIWGLIFAIAYLIENGVNSVIGWKDQSESALGLPRVLMACKTFVIVTIAWVFFRSSSVGDALELFGQLFQGHGDEMLQVPVVTWFGFGAIIFADILLFNDHFDCWLENKHIAIRWSTYAILAFCILLFAGAEDFPFIYFQF